MRDVAPDVGANGIPTDGRLIVIVLDHAMNRGLRESEARTSPRTAGNCDASVVSRTLRKAAR
jgi:hypothetical protein